MTQANSLRIALVMALPLALAACGGQPTNRLLDSVHQPEISHSAVMLELSTTPGGLSSGEQKRLGGWFAALDLRYGDKITLDDPLKSEATRASIQQVASRFGLAVSGDVAAPTGYVTAGSVRVVVSRASAAVPRCPDWGGQSETNLHNATSSNYGCAVNANLAAMVANPDDLVKGAAAPSQSATTRSDKAVALWRDAKPTGGDGLKKSGN